MAKQKTRKTFLGIPMHWDRRHPFKNIRNSEIDEIFPPKNFGIGWTVNLHAVVRKFGFISKTAKKKSPACNEKQDRT